MTQLYFDFPAGNHYIYKIQKCKDSLMFKWASGPVKYNPIYCKAYVLC